MTKIENAVIKYQISFEKYKNGQASEILALLDSANSEISKYLKKTTGVYTKARYKEIAKKLKEISSALKTNVESGIDIDGVIDYELKKQGKILDTLKNDIMKVKNVGEVNFLYPTREQIKTAALFKPVVTDGYGMTFQSYLDGIENGLYSIWDTAVRTGYLTGQPTRQIVQNVLGGVSKADKLSNPGSIASLRNSVYSNTRTILQSMANETQRRVYEENEKYFGGKNDYKYEYLSTLDSRTCLICAAASDRLYKDLKDVPHIPQHRGCVLGDTFISSVDLISKVYRRRYKGLIYRIRTASGNVLSVTPNHPILTDKGFVRAHLLNVGDNVISNNGLKTIDIISKNENNRQVLIKDIFRSFRKSTFMFSCTVPATTKDFHGDAVYNKVNIVSADWELRSEWNAFRLQNFSKNSFVNRNVRIRAECKSKKCRFFQIFYSHFSAFCRFVSRFCNVCNLLWCRMLHSFKLLFVRISHMNVVSSEKSNHLRASKTEQLCNSSNADSMIVKFKNFINIKIIGRIPATSADIGSVENISDDVFGNTELMSNIFSGHSAQIKTDSIVAIDIVKKKFCHVYNLETKNNWYIANGIITHNCRCVIVPYFEIESDTKSSKDGYVDSKITFNGWLKEQDEKTQLDVLGRTRFELYKRGKPITQFVDNGKTLSLDELKNKIDIQAILNQNIKEPDINNLSSHFKERLKERNLSVDDVEDTVKNPIIRYPVRIDGTYKIIGKKVTIGVSSLTGRIVTVWKTGHKTVESFFKEANK